ncbi:MAG: hypothetical protein ACKV19_25210 [Verrucomicrobiales bacterium]
MKSPVLGLVVLVGAAGSLRAEVRVESVPERGLQPEVVVESNGTVHLVYLRGDPKAADIRYTTRDPGGKWKAIQTVNSAPSTGVALGSIRGPQIALGDKSTVHVVWNGVADGQAGHAPLWYTRRVTGAAAFEPQRDLLADTIALDGGASVAADGKGSVWVAWHGHPPGEQPVEARRVVFLRSSLDEGAKFADPEALTAATPGVCACCSLRMVAFAKGSPTIFFRNAFRPDHRAMTLLTRALDRWEFREVETWNVATCPMSSAALLPETAGLLGAWETAGKIKVAWLDQPSARPVTLADDAAKHPVVASDGRGGWLVAWVEGTGWNRGGQAAWQELETSLSPRSSKGHADSVPAWGRVAIYAEAPGKFVLLK